MEFIFKAFQRGDERAYAKLYRRYRKPILSYVSTKVRDPETAEELTQEVFLKAYRARASYDPGRAFATWLWTIARHTFIDWHRAQRGLAEDGVSPEELPTTEPDAETRTSRRLELRQELRKLRGVARKLTALQRRVLWLRLAHHLSNEEIARKLGMSVSAVKCLVYRSRVTLTRLGYRPAFA